MARNTGWMGTPSFSWVAAAVSALMLVLYVQEMLGPDKRPVTGYALSAWALIFLVSLATAVYKTWISDRKE